MRNIDPLDLVDTIREGLLVLEADLTVSFANQSFCRTFSVSQEETVGRRLFELGNGQWEIPELRSLMEAVLPQRATIEAYQVEWVFPSIGHRVMLLNARTVYHLGNGEKRILLAIQDVTEQVNLERERAVAHERITVLLEELAHRTKNNLQIIASIIGLERKALKGEEGQAALERLSSRIRAVARLYAVLGNADTGGSVDAARYLSELSRDVAASLQSASQHIAFETDVESAPLPVEHAIPLGLIVNELVTNSVKYAFAGASGGTVKVILKQLPGQLCVTVADDGTGIDLKRTDSGVGGRLVDALTLQLGGLVERESGDNGTTVSLILPRHDAA